MAWAVPQFQRAEVNRAGRELAELTFPIEANQVLQVVNNWRAVHAFPLNTFQNCLRRFASDFEAEPVIAQRIKRLESIHAKLVRDQTDNMRLTQMQDIAGCRAVMESVENVDALVGRYSSARLRHSPRGSKDYIRNPKIDGYRGRHLVYEYKGRGASAVYSGLKIEIQVRTRLQHAWATAVESVGTFTRQALKANQGDEDWRRFFALMGTAIAAIEGCPSVPGTPTDKWELIAEIAMLAQQLEALDRLVAFSTALQFETEMPRGFKYYVVTLNFDQRTVRFAPFKFNQSQRANIYYTAEERRVQEGQNTQIVLVSVDSFTSLRRAYPNYFLDTSRFGEIVGQVLSGDFPDPQPPSVERLPGRSVR